MKSAKHDSGRSRTRMTCASSLDVSGWDLKKALGLFAKSNPALLEWLRSPIVYAESSTAA